MFLNSLLNKPLFFRNATFYTCIGVGISKKNGALKYLICMHENKRTEFALPFSNVRSITNNGVILSSLRSAIVKNAYVIKTGIPVYTTQGAFIGNLDDAVLTKNVLTKLIIQGQVYPFARIHCILDAILLSTCPVYPLGQRIPATPEQKSVVVTKTQLKKVIDDKQLISFTLSLPPFNFAIHL